MPPRLLVSIALLLPVPALANCGPGAVPSYQDISFADIRQGSLVGILHPSFEFEGTVFPQRSLRSGSADASLSARRAVPFFGNYVAVDPRGAFNAVVAVLEQHRFFDMRMTPMCCYFDGPTDSVTVVRCGVKTALGTVSEGGEADLNDAQGKAFFRLEDELRKTIFSLKWTSPTPAPQ